MQIQMHIKYKYKNMVKSTMLFTMKNGDSKNAHDLWHLRMARAEKNGFVVVVEIKTGVGGCPAICICIVQNVCNWCHYTS